MHIGAHLSSSGGIHTAIDRAERIGAESLQVFTQSPRMWRQTNHDPATFELFRERREEAGIDGVLCHALYLCNFAAPDDSFALPIRFATLAARDEELAGAVVGVVPIARGASSESSAPR